MEVNPILQNVIVAHHIIQVVSPLCVTIIYVAVSRILPSILMILISAVVPSILFFIYWIASKSIYQDFRLIIVHFNPIISTMWFLVFFPFFIICSIFRNGIVTILISIVTGFLSLSSAIFATYGIWKSARNVVLRERSAKRESYDQLGYLPSRNEAPAMYTDLNSERLPQDTYSQPTSNM